MAGNAFVQIRYYNPDDGCIINDTSNVLKGLQRYYKDGKRKPFFDIFYLGESQADEELGTAANSVKDGTTTPFQITVVSASANDTDGGTGHVRKVALIGLTVSAPGTYYALGTSDARYEKPKITVEVINMNGTTDVLSQRYYVRLIHAYACHWGSGGADAAGDITIESPADTDLQTIKANQNESNGCVLFFPEDYHAKLDMVHLAPVVADFAAGDGLSLQVDLKSVDHALNTDMDYPIDGFSVMAPNTLHIPQDAWTHYKLTTIQTTMTFTALLIANGHPFKVNCTVLVKITH